MKHAGGVRTQMKILYLSACSQFGGAERVLVDMLASIRAANSEVSLHVVTTEDGPLISECDALRVQATVLRLPKGIARLGDATSAQSLLNLLAAAPSIIAHVLRLRRVIRSFAPDVIHTNGFKVHVLGVFAKPRGAALVWHIHDFVSSRPLMARLLKHLSRFCDLAMANSGAVAADVRAVCTGINVTTIHNAVDLHRFSSTGAAIDVDELAGMRPSVPDTIRVGLIATLARWKGHETFLRAISLLPRHLPVHGYIIGDAIYQTEGSQHSLGELRALAEKLDVADRVGFTGFIDDAALAMRGLDIIVHASTEREPFGLVIAEAAACGNSIIASQGAGATELMHDGIDFASHDAGDPLTLAVQITHLAADAELRNRLGASARATAERVFDRARLATELLPLYQTLATQTLAQTAEPEIRELCSLTSDI
ncbi:MAG TPA: glycosyltransferase [Pyrinomonadaceae bacterium]|nr:glycosyltransferase [Pyrinomonadaceae bacterium]